MFRCFDLINSEDPFDLDVTLCRWIHFLFRSEAHHCTVRLFGSKVRWKPGRSDDMKLCRPAVKVSDRLGSLQFSCVLDVCARPTAGGEQEHVARSQEVMLFAELGLSHRRGCRQGRREYYREDRTSNLGPCGRVKEQRKGRSGAWWRWRRDGCAERQQ